LGSKTDYDVYIFNPRGDLESVHTESAGLPEHLGNTVDDPFFTPELTGKYYFVILNDPRDVNKPIDMPLERFGFYCASISIEKGSNR